ncbi:uncharacterized protein V1510DRAFT_374069 [Dipodascopsis tothii]|uniref:uncharacterized protein n=1 Tax=Dipodascopsis tothii TaxID=44089 RepID=UPI0034CF5307
MKVVAVLYKAGQAAKDQPRLLGCVENELGLRQWLEGQGHTFVVTDSKEGADSVLDRELVDAEVIITTPFHPGYISRERIARAKNLKLLVTAGVGSDHIDLTAANERKITVAEVTGSNVVSVAEHVVMTILTLVRNFVPAHEQVMAGGWDVADVAKDSYDVEGKVVATIGVGRIGQRVLRRLKAFDPAEMLYYDYQALPADVEAELGARRVESLDDMLAKADIVTVNCPLHESTRGLIDKKLLAKFKKGAWLVNTARGAICVEDDVAAALADGTLRGYGGDVWFPQPAPADHPWRTMRNRFGAGNAMTPHISGTSIDAQVRYAEGTKAIIASYLAGDKSYRPQDLIVIDGHYATRAYGSDKK